MTTVTTLKQALQVQVGQTATFNKVTFVKGQKPTVEQVQWALYNVEVLNFREAYGEDTFTPELHLLRLNNSYDFLFDENGETPEGLEVS